MKMSAVDLFYEKGKLELCTLVTEPTNKFTKLESFVYGIVSFHGGKIRVPGRLTDQIIKRRRSSRPCGARRQRSCSPIPQTLHRKQKRRCPHHLVSLHVSRRILPTPRIQSCRAKQRIRLARHRRLRRLHFTVQNKRRRHRTRRTLHRRRLSHRRSGSRKNALIHSGIDSANVGKVYVGSESNPYAVKPIASKVAQVLKLGEEDGDVQGVDAVDTEFACKAATSMFKDATALVNYPGSGIKNAMVIGADNSQAAPRGCPGGELDLFVGYGGAAFVFGKQDVIAEIEGWYSVTSDTPDFWRRDGEPYPNARRQIHRRPSILQTRQESQLRNS